MKCLASGIWQGSKGIRQWPINLSASTMMIRKITPAVENQWLKRLDTKFNESTNQNLIKSPKSQQLRKRYYKSLDPEL